MKKEKQELEQLKQEFELLENKLSELSEDELETVFGGSNSTIFQHPIAKLIWNHFSMTYVDGTRKTNQHDNAAAGPSSYGMTDTMGRMHSDAQFANSTNKESSDAIGLRLTIPFSTVQE